MSTTPSFEPFETLLRKPRPVRTAYELWTRSLGSVGSEKRRAHLDALLARTTKGERLRLDKENAITSRRSEKNQSTKTDLMRAWMLLSDTEQTPFVERSEKLTRDYLAAMAQFERDFALEKEKRLKKPFELASAKIPAVARPCYQEGWHVPSPAMEFVTVHEVLAFNELCTASSATKCCSAI